MIGKREGWEGGVTASHTPPATPLSPDVIPRMIIDECLTSILCTVYTPPTY